MNDVKLYAFTLLCCSAAAGMTEFLAPESCKKQISYITGMVMLLCMISPLKALPDIGSLPAAKADFAVRASVSADELLRDSFSEQLSEIIRDKLETVGIFADDIRIEITMSEDEVVLESIAVDLIPEHSGSVEAVKQLLSEYLQMDIKVDITRR